MHNISATTSGPSLAAAGRDARCATAAARLYDAESALHAARVTGVDAWVSAAYTKLHVAVVQYEAALASAA